MKKYTLILCLILLCGCGDLRQETTETEELNTETEKVAEIASETPQNVSIKITDEPQEVKEAREKPTEAETEEETEAKTEESTGEVDANGNGWVQLQYSAPYNVSEKHLTREGGVFRYNGHKETWYSIHEPGQDVTAREIPGKHIADDGTIRDEVGYICVASSDLPFYTIVMTSLGVGKVYDCGCSSGTIDIYTAW